MVKLREILTDNTGIQELPELNCNWKDHKTCKQTK